MLALISSTSIPHQFIHHCCVPSFNHLRFGFIRKGKKDILKSHYIPHILDSSIIFLKSQSPFVYLNPSCACAHQPWNLLLVSVYRNYYTYKNCVFEGCFVVGFDLIFCL
ncbi:hypothetical protein Droror1_Dr00018377 [Drosera rotundifolia]